MMQAQEKSSAIYCRLSSKERGFILLPTVVAIMVSAALAALVACGLARCSQGWLRLQDEIRLQQGGRYMQSILEKDLSLDAVRITINQDGKIVYTSVLGCRTVSIYPSQKGIYQRTQTNSGSGVNPLFPEDVPVKNWQVRPLADNKLLIGFTLQGKYHEKEFWQVITCCNGVVSDE
ncbi:hypothetical protein [Phascolarctobacterium sp.]|uniref:hypothetical protein n=1 Tax=Phascolarctobacterium sp. TaxID=2049039 RepID=UPI00386B8F46